jgi:hypothetical protein
MREAAAAPRFQPESDVVVNAHSGHQGSAVRRNDNAQAVFKFGRFYGNMQSSQFGSFT